jgi:hypothetical protein
MNKEIGKVFFEFGVKCLIVVKSDFLINDQIAPIFAKLFYEDLLEGFTVREAFDNARLKLRLKYKEECVSCCCGHSHLADCEWWAVAQDKGMGEVGAVDQAHSLHTPTCSCPKSMTRKHRINCDWFNDFENFYINEEQHERWQTAGATIDSSCCCRPELPHDETMKIELLLLHGNEKYGEEVIFPQEIVSSIPNGRINYGESKFYGNLNFHSINLIGQNKLIYNIILKLRGKHPVVYLYGPPSSGKTVVCKFLMNYLQERGQFKDPQIINKRKIVPMNNNWSFFEDMLTKDDQKDRHLYVLDDFDEIIRHRWDLFHKRIIDFLDKKNFYFVVTLSESSLMNDKLLTSKEAYLAVPKLPRLAAAKLLFEQASGFLSQSDHNIYNLANREIFRRPLMPNEVIEIAKMLRNRKSLKEISSILDGRELSQTMAGEETEDVGKEIEANIGRLFE